jgi:hypothetical protein
LRAASPPHREIERPNFNQIKKEDATPKAKEITGFSPDVKESRET